MTHQTGSALPPGVVGDGGDPGGLAAAGYVSTAQGFQVLDPDTGDVLASLSGSGLDVSGGVNVQTGAFEARDADGVTHFRAGSEGGLKGGSNSNADNYTITPAGEAVFQTLQTNGPLYLPNGTIAATPVSFTASLADQQAQIDEIVALLVVWGVVVDNRVP